MGGMPEDPGRQAVVHLSGRSQYATTFMEILETNVTRAAAPPTAPARCRMRNAGIPPRTAGIRFPNEVLSAFIAALDCLHVLNMYVSGLPACTRSNRPVPRAA